MASVTSNDAEIARLGKERYGNLRLQVETPGSIGKLIEIDVKTGDYEIGDDILEISDRLKARHPDAEMWAERIGYNAVYTFRGTLTRTHYH
jgi:hypothetical protein